MGDRESFEDVRIKNPILILSLREFIDFIYRTL